MRGLLLTGEPGLTADRVARSDVVVRGLWLIERRAAPTGRGRRLVVNAVPEKITLLSCYRVGNRASAFRRWRGSRGARGSAKRPVGGAPREQCGEDKQSHALVSAVSPASAEARDAPGRAQGGPGAASESLS